MVRPPSMSPDGPVRSPALPPSLAASPSLCAFFSLLPPPSPRPPLPPFLPLLSHLIWIPTTLSYASPTVRNYLRHPLSSDTAALSIMSAELTKVDSAVAGLSIKDEKAPDKGHRRTSSAAAKGVFNIKDLEKDKIEITLPIETQKTGWKLNTSPSTIEDRDILKLHLVNPPVKKIDLHFPLGLEVTARNMKGVTIKDALDAIYKQFKKKADDELDNPYLAGFEWDKDECWTRLIVHQTKQGPPQQPTGKKSKKKNKEEA